MAQVSQFSTPENYKKLTETMSLLKSGLAEARLAKQAGIPNADETIAGAERALAMAKQVFDTYFPGGTAPSGTS